MDVDVDVGISVDVALVPKGNVKAGRFLSMATCLIRLKVSTFL